MKDFDVWVQYRIDHTEKVATIKSGTAAEAFGIWRESRSDIHRVESKPRQPYHLVTFAGQNGRLYSRRVTVKEAGSA
ncbi:hypothetical protein D3C87_947780 [compost metagenome]|uniref:Uncharacterized protein n=1 Tax=Achromobacter phage vB_AchrS_AchV4 TaxID=2796514 RepID=A0A7T3PGZ2_9CAUD|nr:hypothetical protein JT316_gp35 [Achromobacter phage vB_AchrS_AchV4]QPZ53303.1 hypothetical protein AchV4_0035 [Achromobacter phage vB_AchrS_AchV4]